jgi:hypothetical protein
MNCGDWEERIALYCGGDLAAAEARAVEEHLADCAGCQAFAGGLQDSLETLREAHAEPIAEAHFAAVRARVMGELECPRRPWRRWAWVVGAAAVAAAATLAVALTTHRPAELPARPVEIAAPVKSAAAPELVALRQPAKRRTRRRVVRARAPQPVEPLVVKLVTDDPNVVIYWITGKSGE